MPTSAPAASDLSALASMLDKRIVAGQLRLPILPDVAVRVREEAGKPTSRADDLARIIELDPALAARILKMANSAMYAGRAEIRNLAQAIGRLGAGMVVAIVMGSVGKEMFKTDRPDFQKLLHTGWERSIVAGAVGRRLAPRAGIAAEEGFLAGLMHRIGVPILLDAAIALARQGKVPLPSVSDFCDVADPLHPRAGRTLLAKWGLPAAMTEAVGYQREPQAAGEEFRTVAALVGIGAAVADAVGEGFEVPEPGAIVLPDGAGWLGIEPAEVESLAAEALAEAREFAACV